VLHQVNAGAERSAILYSLPGTCKINGINPFAWLKDVLEIIPLHPINKIKALLPGTMEQKKN